MQKLANLLFPIFLIFSHREPLSTTCMLALYGFIIPIPIPMTRRFTIAIQTSLF